MVTQIYLDPDDGFLYRQKENGEYALVNTNISADPSRVYVDADGVLHVKALFSDDDIPVSTSLIGPQGPQGEPGEKGDQGVKGEKGETGKPVYTWIKYADDQYGEGISDSPINTSGKFKKYIGFSYNNPSPIESGNPDDYKWSLLKGEDGESGQVLYTWIKYADDANGTGISDSPVSNGKTKAYIGFAYNKNTPIESDVASDYTWSQIKGEDGVPGEKGADGTIYYTWIKYADVKPTSTEDDIYDTPTTDTQYIGIATNQTKQAEELDYRVYNWSKFKGDQGVAGKDGEQGIPGEPGPDGKTYYTWIKYADKIPESNDDIYDIPKESTEYIGIATNLEEQSEVLDYTLYTWSKFKGDLGVSALSINLSNDLDQVYVTNGIVTTELTITTQISILSGSSILSLTSSDVSVVGDAGNIEVGEGSNGIIPITVTFAEGTDLLNIPSLHYSILVNTNSSVITKEFSIIVLLGSVDYDLKISPSVIKFDKKNKTHSTLWLSVHLTEQELTAKNIGRKIISSIPLGYSLTYSRDNGNEQLLNLLGDSAILVYNSTVATDDSVTVYLRKGEELIDKVTVEVVKEGSGISIDYDEAGNLIWKSDFEEEYKKVSDSYLAVKPLMYLPPLAKEGAFILYLGPTRPAIDSDNLVDGVTELECGRVYMNAIKGMTLYFHVDRENCLTPPKEQYTKIDIDGRSAAATEWAIEMRSSIEEIALQNKDSNLMTIYNWALEYGMDAPFTGLYHIIVTKSNGKYELALEPLSSYKDEHDCISLDPNPFNVFMNSGSLTGVDSWLRESFGLILLQETVEYHLQMAFEDVWVSDTKPLWTPL